MKRWKIRAVAASVALTLATGMWSCGGGGSQFNPNITYGEFTDSRDGKKYKTVKIGNQTWMAENLNYNASGSWCYDNNSSNCNTYGRLYDWNTAMAGASNSSANPSGVCPVGWRLPSDAEWMLVYFVGSNAGTKLKSKTGWQSYSDVPAGTDDYGFSALPGGNRWSNGSFGNVGNNGRWWTATQSGGSEAYGRCMYYSKQDMYSSNSSKDNGYSVRCVKD